MNDAAPVAPRAALELEPDPAFVEVAGRIGARLCRDAIWHEDRCTWVGPSMEYLDGQWQVVHRTLGPDLYGGTAGVALFLAELHAIAPRAPIAATARAALRNAFAMQARLSGPTRAGFYSGTLGIVHAAHLLADRLDEPGWRAEAEALIAELVADGPSEDGIDVIMGSAGAIAPLLALHARGGDEGLLALARAHGDALLAKASRSPRGCSWDTLQGGARAHLTGYAHGAGGIALALLELSQVTGDARYREAAYDGIRYEQSCFDRARQNWPDFRDHGDPGGAGSDPVCAVAWCHGAAGIGLSRVRAHLITGDPDLREQAMVAAATTRRQLVEMLRGPGFDFSYCHGVAGNAAPIAEAARLAGDGEAMGFVHDVARWGIATYERPGLDWPCGVPGAGESPSLLLGLAGIGHFLLRLAAPRRVPDVLVVVPPAR